MNGSYSDASGVMLAPGHSAPLHSATVQSAQLADSASPASPWLLGPWYDALLIANVAWPLLLLMQWSEGFSGHDGVQFWQIYFLTTPHRWITLGLVFLDRERLQSRPWLFVTIAAAVSLTCLTIRVTTGTLLCLLTVDYVWNAWHFASQHQGIYRIYSRRSAAASIVAGNDEAQYAWEKWSLRLLLLYVILRVAGATWRYPELERSLALGDWLAWAAAAWLVLRDFQQPRSLKTRSLKLHSSEPSPSKPRRIYLFSMLALYASLLAAVHANQPALVLSLATASAAFHATEYLALVTWSVKRREAALGRRLGVLSYLAPRWGLALAVFMLLLGAGGWFLQEQFLQPWLLLNVIVAFLHYAYDGIVWRRSA